MLQMFNTKGRILLLFLATLTLCTIINIYLTTIDSDFWSFRPKEDGSRREGVTKATIQEHTEDFLRKEISHDFLPHSKDLSIKPPTKPPTTPPTTAPTTATTTISFRQYLEDLAPFQATITASTESHNATGSSDEGREDRIKEYRRMRFEAYTNFTLLTSSAGLGDWGRPAYLDKSLKGEVDEVYRKEKFNKMLSDQVSLDRRLQDRRSPACRALQYDRDLPMASVIIIFCDEAPSVLMRTVHSVVNRSPWWLLEEVLLVDDASTRDDLKSGLHQHIKQHFPDGVVKLIRIEERVGLIRARNIGAKVASGEVLVFLDAHCEVTVQWLEPLLQRIKQDHRAVVCPLIDLICTRSLAYQLNGGGSVGAFDWSLNFGWKAIPERVALKRKGATEPVESAAMAGGLFAMDRSFFFHLGAYDEGMKIWGGENVEMSIRVWTCGGRIELCPCSRVGHLYRASPPYRNDGKDLGINLKRVAEVWLEEYKDIFFFYKPQLKSKDAGSMDSRVQLRTRLECRSFEWYLHEVLPELFVPCQRVLWCGAICNHATRLCWDSAGRHTRFGSYDLVLRKFSPAVNQLFSLEASGRIRKEGRCMGVRRGRLVMEECGKEEEAGVEVTLGILDNMMRVSSKNNKKDQTDIENNINNINKNNNNNNNTNNNTNNNKSNRNDDIILNKLTNSKLKNINNHNNSDNKHNNNDNNHNNNDNNHNNNDNNRNNNKKSGDDNSDDEIECVEVFFEMTVGTFKLGLSKDCNAKNLYQKWSIERIL